MPRIVTSGIVTYLDPANKESYSGSGSSWRDLVGSNTGTLYGSPTFGPENNGVFSFNGTTNYLEKSSPVGISGNAEATLTCWVYPTYSSANYAQCVVVYGNGASAGDTIALNLNTTTFNFSVAFNGGNDVSSGNNAYVPNTTWYNFAITKTPGAANTTTKLYVNGVQTSISTAATITPNVVSTTFRVGRWINNAVTQYFSGKIGGVSIYNRALTASEISQNFNALRGRYGV
jgi:hypothetical protein